MEANNDWRAPGLSVAERVEGFYDLIQYDTGLEYPISMNDLKEFARLCAADAQARAEAAEKLAAERLELLKKMTEGVDAKYCAKGRLQMVNGTIYDEMKEHVRESEAK